MIKVKDNVGKTNINSIYGINKLKENYKIGNYAIMFLYQYIAMENKGKLLYSDTDSTYIK